MKIKATVLSKLLSLMRPHRRSLILGLVFLVISSALSLVYPQGVRWLVDNVMITGKSELLVPVVGGLFLIFVLQAVTASWRYVLFTLTGERIVLDLRKKLFHTLISQETRFYDFNKTGELISRLSSDCTQLQNTVSVNISQGLRNIGQVVGGIFFMFYSSWQLTLIVLLVIPPVGLTVSFFGKKIKVLSRGFQESIADASLVAEETLSGIRTVKSFVQESSEEVRYTKALADALGFAQKRIRTIAIFMFIAMFVGFSSICFVLWYGGTQVLNGTMTSGNITQFLLYLLLVAVGVGSLGSLWGDITSGIGASERIFELMDLSLEDKESGLKPDHLQGFILFENVSFTYPARTDYKVLDQVSFEVKPGQVVALVGPSGSGKSTIAGLIPKFYPATSGSISIDGIALNNLNTAWLRENIGVVSQEPILISSTIEENIRYAKPNATLEEVKEAARSANAWEFIEKFPEGLQTKVGEKGIQLSGGQKQRIAIARAIIKNPRILILDEATSSLDTAGEALVQDALNRLMKDRTTLVIAHRLATIRYADKIFVLHNGKIVEQGQHDELSQNPNGIYRKLLLNHLTT